MFCCMLRKHMPVQKRDQLKNGSSVESKLIGKRNKSDIIVEVYYNLSGQAEGNETNAETLKMH